MKVGKKIYERLMILFGAIVSCTGFIISITIEDFEIVKKSAVPNTP